VRTAIAEISTQSKVLWVDSHISIQRKVLWIDCHNSRPTHIVKAAILALMLATTTANAQQTYQTQHYGGLAITTGPHGYRSTESTYGGLTLGHDNEGNRWQRQKYGNQTFTKITPGAGH
jgi:hypothetical protein